MKNRHLFFSLLASTALVASLSACGEGLPFNLDGTPDLTKIQEAILDVNDRIEYCKDKPGAPEEVCPEIGKPSSSSVQPVPPQPQPESSSSIESNNSSSAGGDSSSSNVESSSSLVSSSSSSAVSSSSLYSSSSLASSSSYISSSSYSSSSSSSVITYTLTCASLPSTGTAGTAVTKPTVTCKGSDNSSTPVTSNLTWTNAPDWANPAAGTYNNVKVTTTYGNCNGAAAATCGGTLTVSEPPPPPTPGTGAGSSINEPIIIDGSGNLPDANGLASLGGIIYLSGTDQKNHRKIACNSNDGHNMDGVDKILTCDFRDGDCTPTAECGSGPFSGPNVECQFPESYFIQPSDQTDGNYCNNNKCDYKIKIQFLLKPGATTYPSGCKKSS